MPRKKAEPEVLQEETVQPEIAQVEETVTAEQPVLEPQVEEPAITEPVQPYGEDDVPAAAEKSESSEPEKKSFYDLDFRALDQDLSPEQRQEWNTIYASFRSRSVMRGTIIGAFHDHPQRTDRRGRNKADVLCGHCAVPRPHFDPGNGNVGRK